MDHAVDRALLARIALGEVAAFEALVTSYHADLWRFLARQLGGDVGLVEEVLQDTALAIWRSAARYRGDANPRAWIFQIAHYEAINARKARQRRPEGHSALLEDTDELLLVTRGPSPEDAVLDRMAMDDALRQLAPKHQVVLELVCWHGFALEEVAQILGVPTGTVKSRLSYARHALAAALAKGAFS